MHDIGWQNRHRTPKYTDMQGTCAFIAWIIIIATLKGANCRFFIYMHVFLNFCNLTSHPLIFYFYFKSVTLYTLSLCQMHSYLLNSLMMSNWFLRLGNNLLC